MLFVVVVFSKEGPSPLPLVAVGKLGGFLFFY